MTGNLEYRITIAGPVAIAPFVDVGTDPILRVSQLQINQSQYDSLLSTYFGCPVLTPAYGCDINYAVQGKTLGISQLLRPVPGTNWVPRMSTGLELQMMLPVVNAPFRIYYAYNALRLNSSASPPIKLTPSMFPNSGAGIYTYQQAFDTSEFHLHVAGTAKDFPIYGGDDVLEKQFRFSVLSSSKNTSTKADLQHGMPAKLPATAFGV